jgi:hypothetical protein
MNNVCSIKALHPKLTPLINQIAHHRVVTHITTIEAVRRFMEQHVFAVWDFACLIQGLLQRIALPRIPGLANHPPAGIRLLYELAASELADDHPHKPDTCISHFHWYLEAMDTCGADRHPMTHCLQQLQAGHPIAQALQQPSVLPSTRQFVQQTFDTLQGNTPALVAHFTFGREALVPTLFAPLLTQIQQYPLPGCALLIAYLTRHIAVDSEDHFPKAAQLLEQVCGHEPQRWQQAFQGAQAALRARINFLEGLAEVIMER